MEDFKVSLESLYTNKIKEISYEEEESYQEKSTLSQRLIDLAQRVDFREAAGEEGAEPASKKPVQQWPWQQANSKLRMALTEASVLTDIIQIVQHQQKYVALNQVVTLPTSMTTPTYQFIMKKRALGQAAAILRKGMDSLSVSSTDREREFHRAIAALRQRWRLKRVGSGVIVGDLSYRSAGSVYAANVTFDVYKNTDQSSTDADVVKVTVPRELRGTSEILVFLSPQPINEMPSLSEFPCPVSASEFMQIEGVAEGGAGNWKEKLSSVQLQLTRAQNVLFNQELFTQLAKEAYDQKLSLQHEVSTNRINIPFSKDCWLSVIYVHERDHTPSTSSSSPSSSWPRPRWDLVVALKQLLRESHRQRATLAVPRPSTMGFQDFTDAKSADLVRNAGVIPLKGKEFKELSTVKKTLFTQFLDKAKHLYNEERLQQWLKELQQSSQDPAIFFSWTPHPSLTTINVQLLLQDSLVTGAQDKDCVVKLVLKVDKVTVERKDSCGGNLTFTLQKEKLISVLKHYITYLHMLNALGLAEEKDWRVTQEVPRPHLSSILAKNREVYPESCNLQLESSDAQVRMEFLFSWNSFSFDRSRFVEDMAAKRNGVSGKWQTEQVNEMELAEYKTTKDKLLHLLNTATSTLGKEL